MKKLIICLLAAALILAPLPALGEGYSFRVSYDADAEVMLSSELFDWGGTADPALIKAMASLVNDMGYALRIQPDGGSLSFLLKEEPLVSAAIQRMDDRWLLASSMLPDLAVTFPAAYPTGETLQALDFQPVWQATVDLWAEFLSGLDAVEEQGNFVGNTFTNGVRRTVYHLDDQQIALLLVGLMDILAQDDAVVSLCGALGLDAQELAAQLRKAVCTAALNSDYRYEISMVYRADGSLLGLSGTALKGDATVGTLSLGLRDDMVDLVIGYGLRQVNYYLRTAATWEEGSAAWTLRFMADPDHPGYDAVVSAEDALILESFLSLEYAPAEEGYDFLITGVSTAGGMSALAEANGSYQSDPFSVIMDETFFGENEPPYLRTYFEAYEEDAIALADWNSLTQVDVLNASAEDDALLDQTLEDSLTELTVRLIKLLPPELLTYLVFSTAP